MGKKNIYVYIYVYMCVLICIYEKRVRFLRLLEEMGLKAQALGLGGTVVPLL